MTHHTVLLDSLTIVMTKVFQAPKVQPIRLVLPLAAYELYDLNFIIPHRAVELFGASRSTNYQTLDDYIFS